MFDKKFVILFFIALIPFGAFGRPQKDTERLFSPSVGQEFYGIAYEMARSRDLTAEQVGQAIIFMTATANLDPMASYLLEDMIKLTTAPDEKNRSELVHQLLKDYIDSSADLEIADMAVEYLLRQLNSRQEREQLLMRLLQEIGKKNPAFSSELATLLGLLTAEKADTETAATYLMRAYNRNLYNFLAFEKLAEIAPEQVGPGMYLAHLRRLLVKNPLNIDAAMAFAQYAMQLELYDTAASGYQYCVDLFGYLYPTQPLPGSIYLSWAISNYNTARNQFKAVQIAEQIRQSGQFDLTLEAIAAKSAEKTAQYQLSEEILKKAEQKALHKLTFESSLGQIGPLQMGWFYCFAMLNPPKALDWANKAYSLDPDSENAAALLAYALVINDQLDWAKPLIENYPQNQVATLSLAIIQLSEDKKTEALESLKSAIASDPASLEAETAMQILVQNGGSYVPEVDPALTLAALEGSVERAAVPGFISSEKMVSLDINLRGSKFSYGANFGGYITITNNTDQPLIVADDALISGNIRVDVEVGGDINKKIPNLISLKTRPSEPIEPTHSLLVPVKLQTGKLRSLLFNHPQASLEIKFTAYLDPVIDRDGIIANRLADVKPAEITVKRTATKLSAKFLQNRFNSIAKGKQGQKTKTTELFTGLLAEQQLMANREPLYKFMYADWMSTLLKSAITQSLSDDDWVVRIHTAVDMLSLPMDYELIGAVSENLHAEHWPVRLMALYQLAQTPTQEYTKVLDWSANYDSNKLVRDMAVALGGTVEPQQQPDEPANENQQPPNNTGRISQP